MKKTENYEKRTDKLMKKIEKNEIHAKIFFQKIEKKTKNVPSNFRKNPKFRNMC